MDFIFQVTIFCYYNSSDDYYDDSFIVDRSNPYLLIFIIFYRLLFPCMALTIVVLFISAFQDFIDHIRAHFMHVTFSNVIVFTICFVLVFLYNRLIVLVHVFNFSNLVVFVMGSTNLIRSFSLKTIKRT